MDDDDESVASDESYQSMLYWPLLDAIEDGASLEEIRSILETAPEEFTHGQAMFDMMFRLLLNNDAIESNGIGLLLLDHDPSCAQWRHVDGEYLLHWACRGCSDGRLDLIRRLLQINPAAARTGSCLPLYLVAGTSESVGVAELVLRHFPEAIRTRDRHTGMLPLHRTLCVRQNIWPQAPLEVMRFWVDAYPEGLQIVDNNNQLPLHLACDSRTARTEVVDYFINGYPEGVEARDSNGCLPLHLSCQRQKWDVARLLISAFPGGARVSSEAGLLPIHCACHEAAPLELTQLLIQAYPESTSVRAAGSGKLALHYACNGHAPLDVIQLLVQSHLGAIYVTDTEGMLPLHCACWHYCDLNHIQFLVRNSDPLTLLQKTHDGKTPLELAYHADHATDEAKRFLLEAQENVMMLYRDAIEFVVARCLEYVDDNNSFPLLVVARIFQFTKPDVWYPPEYDDE